LAQGSTNTSSICHVPRVAPDETRSCAYFVSSGSASSDRIVAVGAHDAYLEAGRSVKFTMPVTLPVGP
jgi:hypothetical protein